MVTEPISVRLRVAGGQVQTDWQVASWVQQRDGRQVAHLRVQGHDFRPPLELGSEILVDIEASREGVQPDAKDQELAELRRQLAELDG